MSTILDHVSPILQKFIVDYNDFKLGKMIGQGGYGKVYIATHTPTGKKCAFKKLFIKELMGKNLVSFCREIEVLVKCDNMFVLPFYGWVPSFPYSIVTEYIPNGSLFHALRHKPEAPTLTPTDKTLISIGISNGMMSLHSVGIIHRDLKSLNILLDHNNLPKICDFGLSRFTDEERGEMTADIGTPHWMAPELFDSTTYTKKVDVYAFGMLMWEMLTESSPFRELNAVQIAFKVTKDGIRPEFPQSAPKSLQSFIKKCWHQDPTQRPSFSQIYRALAKKVIYFPGTDLDAVDKLVEEIKNQERLRLKKSNCRIPPLQRRRQSIAQLNIPRSNNTASAPSFGLINNARNGNKNTPNVEETSSEIMNEKNEEDRGKSPPKLQKTNVVRRQRGGSDAGISPFRMFPNPNSPDFCAAFTNSLNYITVDTFHEFDLSLVKLFSIHNIEEESLLLILREVLKLLTHPNYCTIFIKDGVHKKIPLDTRDITCFSLQVLLQITTLNPEVIDIELMELFSPILSSFPGRILRVISPLILQYDKLAKGTEVTDFLIMNAVPFLKYAGADYLHTLFYLCTTSPLFFKSRIDYIINIISTAILSPDPDTIIADYSFICFFFDERITLPIPVVTDHLLNEDIREYALSYLVRKSHIELTTDIVSNLLQVAPSSRLAFQLLCKYLSGSTQACQFILKANTWMNHESLPIDMRISIVIIIETNSSLRQLLANAAQLPQLLKEILRTELVELISICCQIIFKLMPNQKLIEKLIAAKFFGRFFEALKKISEPATIYDSLLMVDLLSRTFMVPDFVSYVPTMVALLAKQDFTLSALSALASLSSFQKAANAMKKANIEAALKGITKSTKMQPYLELLQQNLDQ